MFKFVYMYNINLDIFQFFLNQVKYIKIYIINNKYE